MPIYYPDILQQAAPPVRFSYTEKDVMLYALGIGLGSDPLDLRELDFVTEKALKVFPTALTVLCSPATATQAPTVPLGLRLSSFDRVKTLHGEQRIEILRAIPPRGSFILETRTTAAVDKGREKGAVIVSEWLWRGDDGSIVATLSSTSFARGDGGFGGPTEGAPAPHIVPERDPDFTVDIPTRPDQALLYRLTGDFNPLHSRPEVAAQAGFPRPILHGMCTYGLTCRAVMQATGCDSESVQSHQLRFSSPVYPGEVVTVALWRDDNVISFEASVQKRGVTVVKNGKTVLRGSGSSGAAAGSGT